MWRFLQTVIFGLVVASNIRWQWTPNGYLASFVGVAVAFLFTVTVSGLIDLWRWLAVRLVRQQRRDDRPLYRPALRPARK